MHYRLLVALLGTSTLCLTKNIPQVALAPSAWVLSHESLGADLNPRGSRLGPESELSQVESVAESVADP